MSIETRLLKSVLDKEVFSEVGGIFNPSAFSEDLEDVAAVIVELHSELEGDLDVDIVEECLMGKKVSTTAKKALLAEIMERIRDANEVDLDVTSKFIFSLARKKQRLDALNALAQIIEKNEDSHEGVIEILNRMPIEEEEDTELVSPLLENLAEQYTLAGNFPFNITKLRKHIGGLTRGNLAVVFGRPELGKSSFVAYMIAGYLSEHKVEYYANEEPGRKIMLNIRRAVTGETDDDIGEVIQQGIDNPEWVAAYPNLKVRQIGEMDIDTIIARAKKSKPDVVVLDQVDKLSMAGKFNNTADRLKALYERTRMLAKTCDCLVINVSQASADADDSFTVDYNCMENSKTGKAGEADIIIGIGGKNIVLNPGDSLPRVVTRGLTISKNKINGWQSTIPVEFDRSTNQWSSGDDNSS